MNHNKVLFNTLLVIIPLYFLQGWLFDHGSIVSQFFVAIWLLIDILYLVRYIHLGLGEPIGRIFFLFWILQTITWIFSPLFSESIYNISWSRTYSLFKNISIVFLTYFPFYFFSYKDVIKEKQLKTLAFFSLICLIGAFFINYNESVFNRGTTEITNNGAYYLVVIIPLLGLFFDDFIEFFFYGGLTVLILTGAKRGAILCGLVELILFVFYYFKKSGQKKSLLKFLWMLITIILLAYVVVNIFEGNDYLQERYDQTRLGDSSLRDEIYSLAFLKFESQSFFHQLFGNGMSSTLYIIDGYAHQDWLELLINNGLLGVFLYASVFVVLFVYFHKYRKGLSPMAKYMFLSSILGWLLRSMYSMGYVSIETCFYSIVFAFVCANQRKISIR